jgi:hypothetical protein
MPFNLAGAGLVEIAEGDAGGGGHGCFQDVCSRG